MNLADMLCYADIHQLHRIAEKYNCSRSNSKNELIQSILSKAYRKETVEEQVMNFTNEDLRFINSVLFDRRNSFSLEELTAKVKGTQLQADPQFNARELIAEYRHRGWLFNGVTNESRYLFHFPEDLKQRIGDVMRKQLSAKLVTTDDPEVYKDEEELLAEDVSTFLSFVYRAPVPLTTAGYMHKRQLQQILQSLAIEEMLVEKQTWRFGYGRMYKYYPDRFSFIYDFCYYNDLIFETGDYLQLTELGKLAVLENHKFELLELYRFWIRLYKGPVSNIQALAHWVDQLATEWTTVQSMTETLKTFIKPFYYDPVESIVQNRFLKMMMHLGLIMMGTHREAGTVIRMKKKGSEIIQGTVVKDDEYIEITDLK